MARLRLPALAAVVLGALALTGCAQDSGTTTAAKPSAAAPAASTPVKASTSAKASAKASTSAKASAKPGTLPNICMLLTKADVTGLTGEQVTLMSDEGGSSPGARYCQWQLSQGQLTVSVNLETRAGFDTRNKESKSVAGIGEAAYTLAGHLYVFEDGKDIDVYVSSEGSDTANLNVARQTAVKVLPRLAAATK